MIVAFLAFFIAAEPEPNFWKVERPVAVCDPRAYVQAPARDVAPPIPNPGSAICPLCGCVIPWRLAIPLPGGGTNTAFYREHVKRMRALELNVRRNQ